MLEPTKELAKTLFLFKISSDDYLKTERLKFNIKDVLASRASPYLTATELDLIIKWKLDKQYHRSKDQRSVNIDDVVIPITKACFAVSAYNKDYQTELRLKLLCSMKGVAIPLASSVLALCFPEDYVIIDSVLWREIYGEEKTSFTVSDYLRFVSFFKTLSKYTKLSLQETEHLLWLSQQN